MSRYAWDETTGKLSANPTAQQDPSTGVGNFANRASNPVIQAASATATEAILWEVRLLLKPTSLFGVNFDEDSPAMALSLHLSAMV